MQEIDNTYIVEIIQGNSIKTGSFLANDSYGAIFFADEYFVSKNIGGFKDLENNNSPKWAVIFDEIGTGNWLGTLFRKILFLSNHKENCNRFIELKRKEKDLRFDRMDLFTKHIDSIQTYYNDNMLKQMENLLHSKISLIEKQISEVMNQLSELELKK